MLEIEQYNDKLADRWDSLVWQANNGTLFHTRKFLSYHPNNRFKDHSLIFNKKNKPFVLFPAAEVNIDNGRLLVSHPGASYGSFVTPRDLSFSKAYELVESLLSHAKDKSFQGIRLTLPPTIYNSRLSNYIDFALLKHGFSYLNREISSILFLEQTAEQNLRKFRPSHRQAVRKAERSGIVIKQSEAFNEFFRILSKNLKIRHNVSPTHTEKELYLLKSMFPDKIYLHGAYYKGKMIAGVVTFDCTENAVLAFYISHDESFQEMRPLNLLFYEIFKIAIAQNKKVFDFGIFTVNEEPNFGLGRFKENFGASGMFRDTFQIIL
ncbi:GNAT family N-acetyltransferase [Candidatus Neomarinimicrobiota bacterium]